jgi:Tfp pilus assembly protein PilO
MADKELEQGLEELESLKQTFKSKLNANDVSTSNVEFRNYPQLFDQLEKKLPTQTKTVTPTTSEQNISADTGYKLTGVKVEAVTSAID